VFERERSGERVLYTAAEDGSGAEYLTDGRLPAWSPRGDTIAYSRPRPDGDIDLYDLWASWSPDASAIAFTVDGTLAMVDVDTRAITPIKVDRDVIGDTPMEFASWGPTGRIAFIAGSDIWTVRPDGTLRSHCVHRQLLARIGEPGTRLGHPPSCTRRRRTQAQAVTTGDADAGCRHVPTPIVRHEAGTPDRARSKRAMTTPR
jgi:hypothetical protein